MGIQKSRIEKWDILKFFLIFLVVLGHFIDNYTDHSTKAQMLFMYIYTFHMPLFIFVSGLFSKKNIQQKRYRNIFSFLALYFFIKLVNFTVKACIYHTFTFDVFSEHGAPWYAFSIFVFSLFTILIRKVSPKYVLAFSIILALLAGYDNDISTFLSLARLLTYFPFFYLGYILNPDKVSEFLSKPVCKIASIIVLTTIAIIVFFKIDSIYWLRPLLTNTLSYSTLKSAKTYGGIDRLIYYVVAILMSASVISLTPNKLANGLIAKLGSRSVQVYSLHYVFIYLIYYFFNSSSYIATHTWVAFPLSIAVTLLLSLKIFEPFFNLILKPKGIKEND